MRDIVSYSLMRSFEMEWSLEVYVRESRLDGADVEFENKVVSRM